MEFGILGALRLEGEEGMVPLNGPRRRALLAMLLLHANEVVPADRLIDALWGDDEPPTAAKALYVHVCQLRKTLRQANGDEPLLRTESPGYLLDVDPERIDARRFERLAREGSARRAHDPDAAARMLRKALSLWRGPALADFKRDAFAQSHIARLEELRLKTIEERIEADLGLGRHGELIGELDGLVVEHPGRERFWAQLMLALYRAGRQADSLRAYRQARRALINQLGIEPSRLLRDLERAVLMQDAALDESAQRPVRERAVARSAIRRKTVTVLAARIALVGAASDPETIARLSISWEREAARAIVRHGGNVHNLAGQSIVGLFGAADTHEDDAARAARAAIELNCALGHANDDLERRAGVRVESAVGLSTGELLVGPEPTAVSGDALHVAAAFADMAVPGETLLDDMTKATLGRAAAVDPAGRRGGVRRWRLLGAAAVAERSPLRLDAPIVGREDELERLRAAFRRVERQQCARLVIVHGAPGIGKSRLAAEFREELGSRATILSGRCLPYGDGITFWPFAEVIRQAVGDASANALAGFLVGDPDAAVIASQIAGAIGSGRPDAGGEETFWAARRFLEHIARDRPVVLILEDLHWAETTLLDLVEHVVDWVVEMPIMVLGLARPELLAARPSLRGRSKSEQIELLALDEGHVRRLIRHLTERRLRAPDADRVVEASGGNPLFIEELTLALRTGHDAELSIPPTIHALIAARLDRLGEPERALLEVAAVIGKEFSAEALLALAPPDLGERMDPHLAVLVAEEFVRDQAGTLSFRHMLVRDAAYAAIPKARRAELHQRLAEWLTTQVRNRLPEYEEVVGYHLEQAVDYRREIGAVGSRDRDLADRAATHLAKAARRAYAREDRAAEITLLSRAAALFARDDPRRAEVGAALAAALRETGDFAAASELTDELVRDPDPVAAARARLVALRIALQTEARFRLEEVEREAAEAVETLGALKDSCWLARAWEILAWVPYLRCRAADAEAPLERALQVARAGEDRRQEARLLSLLFSVVIYGPLPVPDAVARCERVLEEGAVGRTRASAMRVLASLRAMEGKVAEARTLLREDRRLLRELGLSLVAARASVAYGQLELLAGDPERAERELRRGLTRLKRVGERGAVSNVAAILAQALGEQNRHDEALELTDLAKETAADEDIAAQVYWRMPRGRALIHLGDAETGERLLRSAVRLARRTDFLNTHAESLAYLGTALRDDRLLERATRLYDRKGNVAAATRLRSAARV